MQKYKVSYTENQIRTIEVDAESEEDAERMVMDGDADYDQSLQEDATVVSVNSVQKV